MSAANKRKYCVIGTPVAHSKSPELFARIFTERGIEKSCEYVINEIKTQAELETFIKDMRAGLWDGCNVTMPWKNAALSLIDECSVFSSITSAVNTIRRRSDGSLYGTSTDGEGMLWAIRQTTGEKDCVRGRKVVILGAGGSARAVTSAIVSEGPARCSIVCREGANRDFIYEVLKKAGEYADKYARSNEGSSEFIDFDDVDRVLTTINEADIVINCTPLGMIPQEDKLPVPAGAVFKSCAVVADAVYNPEETLFLKVAQQQGCRTVPGRMMLEGQALVAAKVLLDD